MFLCACNTDTSRNNDIGDNNRALLLYFSCMCATACLVKCVFWFDHAFVC